MLSKLLAHEFKVLSRAFIPLNLVIFVLGLLGAAIGSIFAVDLFDPTPITGLLITLTLFFVFFIVPAGTLLPFIISAVRFWQSFLSSEGYLMFTLPMTRRDLMLSKLIPATLWIAITTVVAIVSVMIVTMAVTLVTMNHFADLYYLLDPGYTHSPTGWDDSIFMLPFQIVSLILLAAGGILSCYLSIAVAQLINSNIGRIFVAIGLWFGLLTAVLIGSTMISLLWVVLFPTLADNIFVTSLMYNIGLFAACALMFVVTEQILSKRLNLQ